MGGRLRGLRHSGCVAIELLLVSNAIISLMARGWESKSVEAQQDEAAARKNPEKPRLTRESATQFRDKENLRLSLQSVLQQLERSRDPRHRALLERALADLQRRIETLGS
jgi:hypothetical protein